MILYQENKIEAGNLKMKIVKKNHTHTHTHTHTQPLYNHKDLNYSSLKYYK